MPCGDIWPQPLGTAGREVLGAGVQADQDWKDKVNFLVKGVEGSILAGQ